MANHHAKSPNNLDKYQADSYYNNILSKSSDIRIHRSHNGFDVIIVPSSPVTKNIGKVPERTMPLRKSNSPVVLYKSPHKVGKPKPAIAEVEKQRPRPYHEVDVNVLIQTLANPSKRNLEANRSVTNSYRTISNNISSQFVNDHKSGQIVSPISNTPSKRKIQLEVDELTKKSLKRFENLNL